MGLGLVFGVWFLGGKNGAPENSCEDDGRRKKWLAVKFSIQPIRRSFSMDSASDRQLYLAVQEVSFCLGMQEVAGEDGGRRRR